MTALGLLLRPTSVRQSSFTTLTLLAPQLLSKRTTITVTTVEEEQNRLMWNREGRHLFRALSAVLVVQHGSSSLRDRDAPRLPYKEQKSRCLLFVVQGPGEPVSLMLYKEWKKP